MSVDAIQEYQEKIEKIKNRFKSIKAEAKNDCTFSKEDPYANLNIELAIKWLGYYQDWSELHRTYEITRKEKFRKLFEHYKFENDFKLSSKDEYLLFIESDPNYVAINNLAVTIKEVKEYIVSVIDIIKSRSWEVSNYVGYIKFMSGSK